MHTGIVSPDIIIFIARHADNIKSLNAEWQLKFDDVVEKTSLEIKIEREKFEQKIEKNRLATEASNREKLIELENELRERVKVERDEEIERAVDRIGIFCSAYCIRYTVYFEHGVSNVGG